MVKLPASKAAKALSVATTVSFTGPYYESIVCTPPAVPKPLTPSYNLIVIPGNPGQPGFYSRFVDELAPALPPSSNWRVSVLGLRGHVTDATRSKVRLNMSTSNASAAENVSTHEAWDSWSTVLYKIHASCYPLMQLSIFRLSFSVG